MNRRRARAKDRWPASPVIVGRVPEPGETATCPGCGQEVPLKPLRVSADAADIPTRRPGPVFALHYLPQDGRISPPPCWAYLSARPE